jgi:hypothetical protein
LAKKKISRDRGTQWHVKGHHPHLGIPLYLSINLKHYNRIMAMLQQERMKRIWGEILEKIGDS